MMRDQQATAAIYPIVSERAGADCTITSIKTRIVDCPTTRRHRLSNTEVNVQSYVIAEAMLADGSIGFGEASTLGGPRWAEESVEAIKANIDHYLAPAVIGQNALAFEQNMLRLSAAANRNHAARAAIESALFDAAGHALDLPATAFLGGVVRDRIEVIWALASGDADQEIDEAKAKLAACEHRRFKIKLGFHQPADDMIRLRRIVDALSRSAECIVDVNQGWSEATAIRFFPQLTEMGVALVEQPLRPGMVEATARLAARFPLPIMIDEAAFSDTDIVCSARAAAGSILSLKLVKSGGLLAMKRAAAIAQAFGLELYGGCLLESGIGTAAHLAVLSSLPRLEWGCEHFGPKILERDLTRGEIQFRDFHIHCPVGPGFGISVDQDALQAMTRKG